MNCWDRSFENPSKSITLRLMTQLEMRNRIAEGAPFTVHIADGRALEVPHEDFIHLPPRSTVVLISEYMTNEDGDEETFTHFIPLLMVSGVTREHPQEENASTSS